MHRFLGHIAKRGRYLYMHKVFVLAVLVLFLIIPAVKAGRGDSGSGFLWSPNFGWISLNCFNDWDGNPDTDPTEQCNGPGGNYGVTVTQAGGIGAFTGYAWSPNLGLICFGDTCRDTMSEENATPDMSPLTAGFNFSNAERVDGELVAYVSGWARILNGINPENQDRDGWIRLSGMPGPRSAENGGVGMRVLSERVCVGGVGENCDDGRTEVRSRFVIGGSAWQRNEDGAGVGWIYFGDPPPGAATDGDAGTAGDVPSGLINYDKENLIIDNRDGCGDSIDNDQDDGINTKDARMDLAGRDCFDYDCAGLNFYSTTYPDLDPPYGLHCGTPPPRGSDSMIHENALSPADCFDGIDNDLDAYVWNAIGLQYEDKRTEAGNLPIDCGDPDCVDAQLGERRCTQKELVENTYNGCYNGTDDDGDQRVDCADPDCNSPDGFVLCPERAQGCVCVGHPAAVNRLLKCNGGNDEDGDLIVNACDNCRDVKNPGQEDTDADGIHVREGDNKGGDACDPVAWLETRSGPLYAYKLGGTPPPSGAQGYTATYCILTSREIVPNDFTSEFCGTGSPSGTRPSSTVKELRLRQYATNSSQDSLVFSSDRLLRARLDVSGLKAGRYGKVQELGDARKDDSQSLIIDASTLANPSAQAFRVYHHRGDLTLKGDATFANGVGSTQSGARLIFVEGDLTITGNLAYKALIANADNNPRSLASIGFLVVNGDIKIDPAVASLVGTYITTGTLSTGASTSQLDVAGLLVAQKFEFERTYASLERGAERVIYDGRAALNPPPGFADFLKTLPTFRSIAPR